MLYIFCGDRFIARERSREFVSACKKKRPDAEYIFLSSGSTPFALEELLLGSGLFERKYIVFCDELVSEPFCEHLLLHSKEYHTSLHMFILFEPELSVSDEKKLVAAGAVVQRTAQTKPQTNSSLLFSFADTFLSRDPLRSFSSFHRCLQKGEQASSLLNILLWQIRMLALVSRCGSASEAGVKPFVYTKTKRALSQFPEPLSLLTDAERFVRKGRLRGWSDEEVVEYLLLHL